MYRIISILFIMFFIGCSVNNDKKIVILANEWIGYAPLFYIQKKGYLKEDNIEIFKTISLGESVDLYQNGLGDGLAATQYEYSLLRNKIIPIALIDKSNGADVIMSNLSIEKLKKQSKIYVFLELHSVNSILLNQFLKIYQIPKNRIYIKNLDQQEIVDYDYDFKKPLLIITYAPYDDMLKKRGFKIVDSTKNTKYLVVDALFIDKKYKNDSRIKKLKKYLFIAINEIQKHPKKVYDEIKTYYLNYSYEDYLNDLENIKWINGNKKILNEVFGEIHEN